MKWQVHIQPLKKFFAPMPKVKPKRDKIDDPDNRASANRNTVPKPRRKATKGKS